jgi:acetyltransferase-like isoleucine patch superfamily enzyme
LAALNAFLNKVKRADSPFYSWLKKIAVSLTAPKVFPVPGFLRPPLRLLYEVHFGIITCWHTFANLVYFYPLFHARCESIGKNVAIDRMPFVTGPVRISIGAGVWLGGNIQISSARDFGAPQLIIEDNAQVNWNVMISVNRQVVIEEYARISWNCTISDNDGHPRAADLRARNAPLDPRDIRPVRICKHAWIGNGAHIMKGVTVGAGAVVAANSVVICDVPPYSLALGNPAEIVIRNYGKPSKAAVA